MKTQLPFIYICSLMRTGSTLLQELLMERNKSFIFHEPLFGCGMFQNNKLAHDIISEWGIALDYNNLVGTPFSLMFLRLSKLIPQIGVKEIRHFGWEMYLNLFDDIRFIVLGRNPRDIYLSTHHLRSNWDGWWTPMEEFTVDNFVKEINLDFQRQKEIFQNQRAMKVRYEDLCNDKSTINKVKNFVQSPVTDGQIGYIHERLDRNKIERQHDGQITFQDRKSDDPIVEIQADEFSEKMGEYRRFWGY